jgi:gas vesicle protein
MFGVESRDKGGRGNPMAKPSDEFHILYLMIGVGLGLLAGLLYAPRSGRETRNELRRGARDSLDYVSEEATKAQAGAGRLVDKMKNNFFRRRDSRAESADASFS